MWNREDAGVEILAFEEVRQDERKEALNEVAAAHAEHIFCGGIGFHDEAFAGCHDEGGFRGTLEDVFKPPGEAQRFHGVPGAFAAAHDGAFDDGEAAADHRCAGRFGIREEFVEASFEPCFHAAGGFFSPGEGDEVGLVAAVPDEAEEFGCFRGGGVVEAENEAIRGVEFCRGFANRCERRAVETFVSAAPEDGEEGFCGGGIRIDDKCADEPDGESGHAGLRAALVGGGGELCGVRFGHWNEG